MNLKEVHDLATILEEAIRMEMKVELTIHVEPLIETDET